ncbi:hypothetical protein RhiirA5_497785 [Rhizophagus irregularis]|uniref:Uncharacterized protein n=4 Tax=Rhizophagus irregularis TaxID=588596 RepID=A0A2I1DY87_9GLOM|nr:hypothetical protein RhiirA5_497785 [Rhizophagus irregularis]GBC16848.1 hypothetical protein GLOIN_2v1517790 [Rhizophagus irregularis DAOM 181602=DAOM 197198]PKC70909.1 hypothetical protein RhiirA1_439167 [Rhizophagus irregularis]PKK78918.1 hypothetical protein RhiirC2_860915 [Rhizophagus irregularis]PKY14838.1 hypothetical protein RhiirB3_519919 [Rhizophagus irregularis]
MFKLLTNKSVLRTFIPRFYNNKEQYFRAKNVSLRISSTIHHQIYNKVPFPPYLPCRNKPQSPFLFSSTNFTRSISSFPPSRMHSPPQRTLKQLVAFGGATLTFFIIKPTLFYIINGAIAFGAYKFLKRLLDYLFPAIDINRKQFYNFNPTTKLTKIQSKLYTKSIEQIKKVNLNYNIIGFTGPHTISTESVEFNSTDSQQKYTLINIEYWAIDELNNKKAIVKVEGMLHNHDDFEIKNIEMYWPNTGQVINVPTDLKQDSQGYRKPPIIEAEFRDID